MLPHKQLGWSQQDALHAGRHTAIKSASRNHRFSAADIALQQAVHDMARFHIGKNFIQAFFLVFRQRISKIGKQAIYRGSINKTRRLIRGRSVFILP